MKRFNYSFEYTSKPEFDLSSGVDLHTISPNDLIDGSLRLIHNNKPTTLTLIEIQYEKVTLGKHPQVHTVSQKVFKNRKQKQPTILSSHYL